MKKIKFLMLALFAVLACVSLASCSDDDKDEPNGNNSIVGKWNCYKVVAGSESSSEDIDLIFHADNSCQVEWDAENIHLTGKYTVTQAGALSVTFDNGFPELKATYSVSGNEMTAKFEWRNTGSGTAYLKRIK